MIGLLNYNFCGDANSADSTPTSVTNITSSILRGGIYDHFNISKDVTSAYSTIKPTAWDFNTIVDAGFNGNLSGGSLSESAQGITSVKIKRREFGSFNWVTIKIIPINSVADFQFQITDNLTKNGIVYEYAFVPVRNNVEGSYITSSVLSQFSGLFICDVNTIHKMYVDVKFGETDNAQQIGIFNPFGRQYPVVVSNSLINYQTGSFSGMILPQNYENGGVALDRLIMQRERNIIVDFLSNKKAKIIKTVNGDMWLCMIVGNIATSYSTGNMGAIPTVFAQWTEIGNKDNAKDLYHAGLIPTAD